MNIKEKIYHWRARRAAKKYKLDFEHNCVFDHQLRNYGLWEHGLLNTQQIVEVEMESGKTGLYIARSERLPGDTGQKNWKFEFQGYANDAPVKRL